jgi:ubiquinone/menaquinone biosynthesis C-methylase UbiE
MTEIASEFVGDIPANYDNGLGPVIFEDYAHDISERAAGLAPSTVLELAAGTGIVSRKLRDKLPATTSMTVTDLNPPMLEVARTKLEGRDNVIIQPADAMALPFADDSFDLVVCQFGVMFFPDKVASYREALRVLRPGGTYLFNAWGTNDENPFSAIAQNLSEELFPDDPPGFYRVPFSYADPARVIADIELAGFTDIDHQTIEIQKSIRDLEAFARGVAFGNPIYDEILSRGGIEPSKFMAQTRERFAAAWGTANPTMPLKATVYWAQSG